MASATEIDDRISKCERILVEDPNSQIFAALADSYRKKGEFERAFRICQNGLKVHPSYGAAHVIMSKINLDRGLYDWAEIEAKRAAELDGRTRTIEMLLAEIYIYKGEFASAIKLLKRLHESDPSNAQIKKLLDIARKLPQEQIHEREGAEPTVMMKSSDSKTASTDESKEVEKVKAQEISPLNIVERALEIAGVDGALFTNMEGLVVESKWRIDLDPTACGASMTEVGNDLNEELLKASFGKIRAMLVETEGPLFYMFVVRNGVFLFVGSQGTNLGALRMNVEKLIEEYNSSGDRS